MKNKKVDEKITEQELMLVRDGARLTLLKIDDEDVKLDLSWDFKGGGRWMYLNQEQLVQLIEFLKRQVKDVLIPERPTVPSPEPQSYIIKK